MRYRKNQKYCYLSHIFKLSLSRVNSLLGFRGVANSSTCIVCPNTMQICDPGLTKIVENATNKLIEMKRLLLVLFINFVLSYTLIHAHNAVKIIESDGNETIFILEKDPNYYSMEVFMIGSELEIYTQNTQVNYEIDQGVRFEFLDYDARVDPLEVSDPIFNISRKSIEGKNLPVNSLVYLYDLTGILLKKAKVDSTGSLKIDISEIPEGNFIIKSNSKSFKFFKK